jgi:DME family drug/metabolite transporter
MRKQLPSRVDGFWLVSGAALLWGTIGVATQAIYNSDTTTSLFINLSRMLIASPVLLVACWHVVGASMFHIGRRDAFIMLLTGTMLAISQVAYFAAIRSTGVTIATLLTLCVAPLVVTGVSVALRLETLTRRLGVALGCALLGSILLVGLHTPQDPQQDVLLGALFAILSGVTYGGMMVCGRFLAADYHPLQVTAFMFGAGTLALVPINLVSGIVIVHTVEGWLLVLYLGLVPTALAYWLFQKGLRSVSATAASIMSLLEPLVAALLAWALFGEMLGMSGLAGGALLVGSIVLLSVEKE